ncbi:guanylate-binding protein 7-like [Aquarana catesbeiana]|uniref:guanylate-binding protein 7-like n=1 Tax=Aquarana catesbeiana TaxID=8400 RepID=UPI003CC9F9A2
MESAFKMDCPVCLIENKVKDGRAQLVVNPEAINILSKIPQQVVVVSIVGNHQTGKSYLMNRLAGAQKGFTLGSTIQVQTKGIWMWCVPHPNDKDRVMVLLDTEGLGDVEKGDTKNDSKIFTLAVLLSSALVYNSKGAICQDDLDKLKYVGELTEIIKVRTGDTQEEKKTFSTYFPIFIWAVRDFTLELKFGGKVISADDYLENALKHKTPETSSKEKEYNELRRRLKMCFETRKCFVFDVPTDSTKALKKLEQLLDDRLSEDFLSESTHFCDYIFQKAEVKRVDTTVNVTGHRLGELANLYTEAINSSNVVCLEEATVSLTEKENKIAVQEATKYYEDKMKTIVLPTDTLNQFLDLSTQYENEAQKIFLKRSIKDTDKKFFQEFMENLKKIKMEFSVINEKKSQEKCQDPNKKHSLAEGRACKHGGLEKSKKSLKTEQQNPNREGRKRAKVEAVLQEDKTSKQTDEILIMHEDNPLSQKQKEEEGHKKPRLDVEKSQKANLPESNASESQELTTPVHLEGIIEKSSQEVTNSKVTSLGLTAKREGPRSTR